MVKCMDLYRQRQGPVVVTQTEANAAEEVCRVFKVKAATGVYMKNE